MTDSTTHNTLPTRLPLLKACEEALASIASPLGVRANRLPGVCSTPDSLEIFFEAAGPQSHNLSYYPGCDEWIDGCFALEHGGHLIMSADGAIQLVGDDADRLDTFPIEQPAELVEFIEFYRDAAANVNKSVEWRSAPLSELLEAVGVPLWLDAGTALFHPVDNPDHPALRGKPLAGVFMACLRRDLGALAREGAASWPEFCRQYARPFAVGCRRDIPEGFMRGGDGLAAARRVRLDSDSLFPAVWLVPAPHAAATLFLREFFGHCAEGVGALDRLLRDPMSVADLRRNLDNIRVDVPADRAVQIRLAIEWRLSRLEARNAFENVLGRLRPARRLGESLRGLIQAVAEIARREE